MPWLLRPILSQVIHQPSIDLRMVHRVIVFGFFRRIHDFIRVPAFADDA
jgi:hypothetical protein